MFFYKLLLSFYKLLLSFLLWRARKFYKFMNHKTFLSKPASVKLEIVCLTKPQCLKANFRVRKARRNSTAAIWVTILVSGFLMDWHFRFDFIPGLLLALGLATWAAFIMNWYYGVKEVRVLRKIESLKRDRY
jgi:hypothetical protein